MREPIWDRCLRDVMPPKTIEGAYLDYMNLMKEVQQHDLELSAKGHHVFRNTWLCAAMYFWNRMKRLILIESDKERDAGAARITNEIENAEKSEQFQEFHAKCFPEVPVGILAATWTCSGRATRDIGLPILSLGPSKRRKMLIKGLDLELDKLHLLWMVQGSRPGDN